MVGWPERDEKERKGLRGGERRKGKQAKAEMRLQRLSGPSRASVVARVVEDGDAGGNWSNRLGV